MVDLIGEVLAAMATDSSRLVQEAALTSMDRVRAKQSVDRFRAILKKGTLEEKVCIVYTAGEIAGGEGIALLLEALSDKAYEVRGAAVRALLPLQTPVVLRALWDMIPKEKNGVVLGNIVEVFGASGRKELSPHIEKYLSHPEVEVRAKAIIAVSRLTDGAGWEKILALRGDPNEMIRAAVAEGLGNWTFSRP